MTRNPLPCPDSSGTPQRTLRRLGAALAVTVSICGSGCVTGPVHKLLSDSGQASAEANAGSATQPLNFGDADVPDPVADPEQQQRSVLFAKARLLEADHQPEQAARLYEQILKSEPKHSAALHRLAVVYSEQGEIDGAEKCFQKALRIDDQNADLHSDYGYYCYLVRRWSDAETHLQRAIELNPSLLAAHNNLGLLAAQQGQPELAIRHCRDAGCSPDDALHNTTLNQPSQDSGAVLLDGVASAK